MKENMKAVIYTLGTIIALLILLVARYQVPGPALGGATPGTPASLATSSTIQLGPQVNNQLWASNNNCAARIISTQAQPIMIAFGDDVGSVSSTTLSQTIGHLQAGSSTVAYDSAVYGCGRWFGYAAASTTITKLETQ